ncbi:hypothetical protein L596_009207 [Steinernema carpocapsae]|uniref:Uncharacterized protein n=1 Tax=Steinernema carpocapsae TaxID=34508 RepID=A0A4U5PEQ5_STECR|nr:hypothetical protein L596_009207 [Steinernema carpocapsae]
MFKKLFIFTFDTYKGSAKVDVKSRCPVFILLLAVWWSGRFITACGNHSKRTEIVFDQNRVLFLLHKQYEKRCRHVKLEEQFESSEIEVAQEIIEFLEQRSLDIEDRTTLVFDEESVFLPPISHVGARCCGWSN